MRLIAWNTNYNCHKKRPLEEVAEFFNPLEPDVLILSETIKPNSDNPLGAHWIGKGNPGLAVIARKGWTLSPQALNEGAAGLMGGFVISGKCDFHLLAIWPVNYRDQKLSYHKILMHGLDRYSEFLDHRLAIAAGDFNSNTRVSSQRTTHPAFVAAMKSRGMASAYHEKAKRGGPQK